MSYKRRTARTLNHLRMGMGLVLSLACIAQEKPRLGGVTDIRSSSHDGVTRVTVSVKGIIDIKAERIENPARVFIDFQNTTPMLVTKLDGSYSHAMQTIRVGDKILTQIRVAENQKGVTRLVFDLVSADVEHRTSVLEGSNQLLIELRRNRKDPQLRNPLADAPPPVTLSSARPPARKLELAAIETPKKPAFKSTYRMPDPPILTAALKLPKPEASQVPYQANGFVFTDKKSKPLPYAPQPRQATERIAPAVAAAKTSSGRQSLTRVLGLKIGKVVIDAGHGGHDAGTIGPSGLTEKEVVLDIAKRLALLIQERLGSEVVFTREDDTFIPLEGRTAMANQSHADLFISIHANSSPAKVAGGVETYYLNFTSSPEALEVAARENASGARGVSDLGDLIKKIALKDKIDESREFATKVQSALHNGTMKAGNATKDRGVRKAPFVVLIGAQMPSVLTEIGFLSNPREESLLKKSEYRQKIAESLFRGVGQYASTLSHFTVAQLSLLPEEN